MLSTLKREKLSATPNNYIPWKEGIIVVNGPVYGRMVGICKYGTAFKFTDVVPDVKESDYLPADSDGLDEESKLMLKREALKSWVKRVQTAKDLEPKFFETLWSECGYESQLKLQAQAGFDAIYVELDPYKLWLLIEQTHNSEVAETNEFLKLLNRDKKEEYFNNMKMPTGMKVEQFKKDFDRAYETAKAAGMKKVSDERLAVKFVLKLEDQRFQSLRLTMENNASMGMQHPDTLQKMFEMVNRYRPPTDIGAQKGSRAGHSNLPSTSSNSTLMTQEKAPEEKTKEPVCWHCGSKYHKRPNCPDYTPAENGGNQQARGKRKAGPKTKAATSSTTTLAVTVAPVEASSEPSAPIEHDDSEWEAYDYSFVSLKTLTTKRLEELFSPTDVLLDSQAGGAVFRNKNLLSKVRPVNKYYLGGVDDSHLGF